MNKFLRALILVISGIITVYSMEDGIYLVSASKSGQVPTIIVSSETTKSSQSSVEIEWNSSPYVSPESSGEVSEQTFKVCVKQQVQESISRTNETRFSYSRGAFCWYVCFLCCLPQHLGYTEVN